MAKISPSGKFRPAHSALAVMAALVFITPLAAQLSSSAYRAAGQPDLRQNGVNGVQGRELYGPSGLALDSRGGQLHLYISDTRNHRILAWRDARAWSPGSPADLVLGQPSAQHSAPLGIGSKGLYLPYGLAVDPATGNLFVADAGNNRVLRFAAPFEHATRIEPDAVYGQAGFASRSPNPSGVAKNSLRTPRGVAVDSSGNLWIADTGNHRVLRYPAAMLDDPKPEADIVIGQADFGNGSENRGAYNVSGSGFNSPYGLAFDGRGNLYVADYLNTRVLRFAAPFGPASTAAAVYGEPDVTTRGVPPQPGAGSMAGPAGLAFDSRGNLYVAVPQDNRLVMFAAGAETGALAKDVWGQISFASTQANRGVFPRASASTLSGVCDVAVDPDGNIFAADAGNNRVLSFPNGVKNAAGLWGQPNFAANGANQIKPGSINGPYKMAIDYSERPFPLYVSDTNNHRVLVWKDVVAFRTGDPADFVIGQPDMNTAIANADTGGSQTPTRTSLSAPKGIAVDAGGNLYVADSDNNRVLRYPKPVRQSGRITPDIVIGQADFTSAESAAVNSASLHAPAGVAIGPDGNLFVADSANNRVLEFAPGSASRPAAIRVYGQRSFTSAASPSPLSAQTLAAPQGVYVDGNFNLYVADTAANRVLIFSNTRNAPAAGLTASVAIGQDRFDSPAGGSGSSRFNTPSDVFLDSAGSIYVSDYGNNRVLVFPSLLFLPIAGATATSIVGQRDFGGTSPNWNTPDGLATPEGLYAPVGLLIDRRDTLYIGDTGNNRVLHFLKTATVVNGAHFTPSVPVAKGTLVTLFGSGLADQSESAAAMPWPPVLAGREVVMNDEIRAALLYAGPTQVNFQLPSATSLGQNRIAVRAADTGELIAGGNVPVASASPAFFSFTQDGKGQASALNQDGTPNSALAPAARGSVVSFYGTGQGDVAPAVADGSAAPSSPPASTVAAPTADGNTCLNRQPSVCMAIGSTFGEIQFSGLAPGLVGIWQLNVRIPDNALTGNSIPVRAVVNGTPSNIVSIAIK